MSEEPSVSLTKVLDILQKQIQHPRRHISKRRFDDAIFNISPQIFHDLGLSNSYHELLALLDRLLRQTGEQTLSTELSSCENAEAAASILDILAVLAQRRENFDYLFNTLYTFTYALDLIWSNPDCTQVYLYILPKDYEQDDGLVSNDENAISSDSPQNNPMERLFYPTAHDKCNHPRCFRSSDWPVDNPTFLLHKANVVESALRFITTIACRDDASSVEQYNTRHHTPLPLKDFPCALFKLNHTKTSFEFLVPFASRLSSIVQCELTRAKYRFQNTQGTRSRFRPPPAPRDFSKIGLGRFQRAHISFKLLRILSDVVTEPLLCISGVRTSDLYQSRRLIYSLGTLLRVPYHFTFAIKAGKTANPPYSPPVERPVRQESAKVEGDESQALSLTSSSPPSSSSSSSSSSSAFSSLTIPTVFGVPITTIVRRERYIDDFVEKHLGIIPSVALRNRTSFFSFISSIFRCSQRAITVFPTNSASPSPYDRESSMPLGVYSVQRYAPAPPEPPSSHLSPSSTVDCGVSLDILQNYRLRTFETYFLDRIERCGTPIDLQMMLFFELKTHHILPELLRACASCFYPLLRSAFEVVRAISPVITSGYGPQRWKGDTTSSPKEPLCVSDIRTDLWEYQNQDSQPQASPPTPFDMQLGPDFRPSPILQKFANGLLSEKIFPLTVSQRARLLSGQSKATAEEISQMSSSFASSSPVVGTRKSRRCATSTVEEIKMTDETDEEVCDDICHNQILRNLDPEGKLYVVNRYHAAYGDRMSMFKSKRFEKKVSMEITCQIPTRNLVPNVPVKKTYFFENIFSSEAFYFVARAAVNRLLHSLRHTWDFTNPVTKSEGDFITPEASLQDKVTFHGDVRDSKLEYTFALAEHSTNVALDAALLLPSKHGCSNAPSFDSIFTAYSLVEVTACVSEIEVDLARLNPIDLKRLQEFLPQILALECVSMAKESLGDLVDKVKADLSARLVVYCRACVATLLALSQMYITFPQKFRLRKDFSDDINSLLKELLEAVVGDALEG